MIDLDDFETNRSLLEAYGYRLVTWEEFCVAQDVPEGLLDRAVEETADREEDRDWVVYDPDGDAQDWMLTGDRDVIARTVVEHIIRLSPPTGPLSSRELDRSATAPRV